MITSMEALLIYTIERWDVEGRSNYACWECYEPAITCTKSIYWCQR